VQVARLRETATTLWASLFGKFTAKARFFLFLNAQNFD